MFSVVELHFSNRCTGNCVICSKAHGGNRPHFMPSEVVDATVASLKRAGGNFELQLGGDGDAFLNPNFLNYLIQFKHQLPDAWRCLYTSAFSLNQQRTDFIVAHELLNEMQVRIDSLDEQTYYESTGMFLPVVLDNLRYFAERNVRTKVCIIYMPLYKYRALCEKKLGKSPTYLDRVNERRLIDEWLAVRAYFGAWSYQRSIETRVTGISLWAERTDCEYGEALCPRLPENRPGDMKRQIYVYPNGDIGLCGYDDAQDTFILGNVLKTDLAEAWMAPRKENLMEMIRRRTKDEYPTPCINPAACTMWDV